MMQVFWAQEPGFHPHCIDEAITTDDGVTRGRFGGKTLEELRVWLPRCDIKMSSMDEFIAIQEASMITAPKEISREDFIDALEVLPPMDWQRREGSESFKFSEHYSGRITSIYARIGKEYFTFQDVNSLTHEQIVAKVKGGEA